MCINNIIGELPGDLLHPSKSAAKFTSPSPSSSSANSHRLKRTKPAKPTKPRKQYPILKTNYIVPQSDFVHIAAKPRSSKLSGHYYAKQARLRSDDLPPWCWRIFHFHAELGHSKED